MALIQNKNATSQRDMRMILLWRVCADVGSLVWNTHPQWLHNGSQTCLSPFCFNSDKLVGIFFSFFFYFVQYIWNYIFFLFKMITTFPFWLTKQNAHIITQMNLSHTLTHLTVWFLGDESMFQVLRQKHSSLYVSSLCIYKWEERAVNLNEVCRTFPPTEGPT